MIHSCVGVMFGILSVNLLAGIVKHDMPEDEQLLNTFS